MREKNETNFIRIDCDLFCSADCIDQRKSIRTKRREKKTFAGIFLSSDLRK